MKNIRVALIGSYPPPYGGVSIHIQRLHSKLLNNGVKSYVVNMSSNKKRIRLLLNMKKIINWVKLLFLKLDIFHLHTSGKNLKWVIVFFLFSKLKKTKFIITFHSFRYELSDISDFYKHLFRFILKRLSHVVVTNNKIKERLIGLGSDKLKISVIPAFIAPELSNNQNILPKEIISFIKRRSPIISSYAYTLKDDTPDLNEMGTTDLYGVSLLLDLCINMKKSFPQIGIILSVANLNDEGFLKKIKTKINKNNIRNNFFIYGKPVENIHNLWSNSDVYVRPTLSDGDSIALREALLLKTPSVASDATPRPEGTIIFQNQNLNDFSEKVKGVLENSDHYKIKLNNIKYENNFKKLLNIYEYSYKDV
jgi:glycosyltransferase involved in cell wall biosynthesis